MKVYIYRRANYDFYISTKKPTKNEWDELFSSYNPFDTDRPDSQLPISMCNSAARKLIKGSGKRLPAKHSNEILELDLTVK